MIKLLSVPDTKSRYLSLLSEKTIDLLVMMAWKWVGITRPKAVGRVYEAAGGAR